MKTVLTLPHDEMVPFVRQWYFREISWVVLAHYLISVLFFALWLQEGIDGAYGIGGWLGRSGLAVLTFIVLVPLHELIHGLFYWTIGADDVRFRISLRHAYAYAIAHRHVTSAREFTWIAVAPFILVTSMMAGILSLAPEESFLIMGILFLHTAGCAGDWAMLNYVWSRRNDELYTFDDADMRVTYFVTPPGQEE